MMLGVSFYKSNFDKFLFTNQFQKDKMNSIPKIKNINSQSQTFKQNKRNYIGHA